MRVPRVRCAIGKERIKGAQGSGHRKIGRFPVRGSVGSRSGRLTRYPERGRQRHVIGKRPFQTALGFTPRCTVDLAFSLETSSLVGNAPPSQKSPLQALDLQRRHPSPPQRVELSGPFDAFLRAADLALRFSQALSCNPLRMAMPKIVRERPRAKSRWRSTQI